METDFFRDFLTILYQIIRKTNRDKTEMKEFV